MKLTAGNKKLALLSCCCCCCADASDVDVAEVAANVADVDAVAAADAASVAAALAAISICLWLIRCHVGMHLCAPVSCCLCRLLVYVAACRCYLLLNA